MLGLAELLDKAFSLMIWLSSARIMLKLTFKLCAKRKAYVIVLKIAYCSITFLTCNWCNFFLLQTFSDAIFFCWLIFDKKIFHFKAKVTMLCFSIKLSPWFQIVVVNQMVIIVTYKELNGLPRILKILRTRWGKIR